jgi:hypothetical protein
VHALLHNRVVQVLQMRLLRRCRQSAERLADGRDSAQPNSATTPLSGLSALKILIASVELSTLLPPRLLSPASDAYTDAYARPFARSR